jgi:hypothetical protein
MGTRLTILYSDPGQFCRIQQALKTIYSICTAQTDMSVSYLFGYVSFSIIFLYRMIAIHNQHLSPDNLKKLEKLLEFLLTYSIQELTKQFSEGKIYYIDENFKDKKGSIPNICHLDAVASISSLKVIQ